jgi:hypothetical protein
MYSLMKQVYPFVPRTEVKVQEGVSWTEITTAMFPICPIRDVVSGVKSTNAEYLFARADKSLASYIPATAAEASKNLDGFSTASYIQNVLWDIELIRKVDGVCYFVLKNGVKENQVLTEKLISVYYEMISTQLGVPVTRDPASFDTVVYQSIAYSPYRTTLVLDYAILRDREVAQDPTTESTKKYTDLRSLFNTLILLYLYEK